MANVKISETGSENSAPAGTTFLEGETIGGTSEHFEASLLLSSVTNGATAKTTMADADRVGFWDSVSELWRHITWLKLRQNLNADGWIPVSDTWTYASASTITAPSGAASFYSVGDKIKMTNSGTKYNYIVGVADTVLTVKGDGVANAAITAPYYSKVSSPLSFPQYFAYTPTGISASNVTQSARFMISGRRCYVDYVASFTGAITFTTMPTLPVTSSASVKTVEIAPAGFGGYYNGSVHCADLIPMVNASATTFLLKTATGASMSATVPVTWANTYAIEVHFSYEI